VLVAISGSHGFIGSALVERLSQLGHDVVRLVRSAAEADDISWDPAAGRLKASDLIGVDAVVNLAGAGVGDKRWTEDYKRQIKESRTKSTALLSATIASIEGGPRVLLSASGVHVYGDRGDEEVDERSSDGTGFLADVCREWEASTAPAEAAGVRVAYLRSGIVLAASGGALKKMLPLFKLGLGGRFGSGRQWMSWISRDDHVGAIVHVLTTDVAGPVNLVGPRPVRNAAFADTLGEVLRRPTVVPVPSFGPKLLLGPERADAMLFDSIRVRPRVLERSGFTFAHPDLESALRSQLGR
jgi:uncharacterized protein (TIGR01777 family)